MTNEKDCIFCKILTGESEVGLVYRDEVCAAFMDIQPVNPGHLLVIPDRRAAHLADLREEEGAQMFRVARRLAAALRRSGVKCDGVNFLPADGEAATQEVLHAHLHEFPRHRGDGFGLKLPPGYFQKPGRDEWYEAAGKIRGALEAR